MYVFIYMYIYDSPHLNDMRSSLQFLVSLALNKRLGDVKSKDWQTYAFLDNVVAFECIR